MNKYIITFLVIGLFGFMAIRMHNAAQEAATIQAPPAARTNTSGETATPPVPGQTLSPMNNSFSSANSTQTSTTSNPTTSTSPTTNPPTSQPADLRGGGGGKAAPNMISRTLSPFSKNNPKADVISLQNFLKEQGYLASTAKSDGVYGNMTKQAVMKFQKARGINPTGNLGPITLGAINDELGCENGGTNNVKCQRGLVN